MSRPTPRRASLMPTPEVLDLSEDRLGRTIAGLAGPAILENMIMAVAFLAAIVVVGWLRSEASLAASALAGTLLFVLRSPFIALRVAAASLISRAWGEQAFGRAAGYALLAGLLGLLLSLVLLIPVWYFAAPIIRLLGGEPDVVQQGEGYLRIMLLSLVVYGPVLIGSGVLRATGDARTPLLVTIFISAIGIPVAAALAFGWGPFPRLGLNGVAWGSVGLQAVGMVLMIDIVARRMGGWGHMVHAARLDRAVEVWNLAAPTMVEFFVHTFSILLYTRIVAILGTAALAAHQIVIHVESIALMPATGLSSAIAAVVGQCIGAGRIPTAERTVRLTALWSGCGMAVLGLLYLVGAPYGVRVFGATEEVLALARIAIQVCAFELPFMALTFVLGATLRSAGDTRSPVKVTIMCLVLFRFGAVWLLGIHWGWGLGGVWLATTVDWAVRALLLWRIYLSGKWKTLHRPEAGDDAAE